MSRISLYALIPYALACITFGTEYFDLYISAFLILSVMNFIRRRKTGATVFILLFVIIGCIRCADVYPDDNKAFYPLLDEPASLTCIVDDIPSNTDEGISFTAEMISAVSRGEKFQLNGKVFVYVSGRNMEINHGDMLDFKTVISLPADNLNTGSFSYRQHLRSQGIYAACNTYDFSVTNHGKYDKVNPLIYNITSLRKSLIEKCNAYFDSDTAAFMKALLLGYKSDMTDDMKAYITRSGISHIISVSGLHLSILMIIVNAFIRRMKFRGSMFVIPFLNILCALFITVLTGFSPSVNRAAIMLIISNSASMFYRENDSLQSLSFAVLILLLINPCAIHDVRLVLSAMSTLGIILYYEKLSFGLRRFLKFKKLCNGCAMTLSAQALTIPFCVLYFNTVSVLGIVTNLIVVPIIPYLMGLGVVFLIASMTPIITATEFLSGGIWLSVSLILDIARMIAKVPFAQAEMGLATFVYIAVLCAVIFCLMRKTVTSRKLYKNLIRSCISCIAVFFLFLPPNPGYFRITVINVGQGDCTLLQFPNSKTMLIDGGGDPISSYDTAENIIRPFLIQNGIARIDYAVISHFDTDHCDGILNLADDFKIGCIIAPDYLKAARPEILRHTFDICGQLNIPLYLMDKGDDFSPSPEVNFTVYSPDVSLTYDENNSSMVAKVSAFGKSVLLTGDIEDYAKKILSESDAEIDADILKSPHHGSYTVADEDFLRAVNPDIVYICVGKNNTYGHPSKELLELYADYGIDVFRTDIDETIRFTIRKNGDIIIG